MAKNKSRRLPLISKHLWQILGILAAIVVFLTWLYFFKQTNTDTRSKAAALPKDTKFGAYFFYWHDCPTNNCDTSRMPFPPRNPAGYSIKNKEWLKQEFKDMAAAGINYVIPVSWGSHHPSFTWFRDSTAIPLMVQVIQENKLPLKIALLDDTNSVVSEWNADNGRGYADSTGNPQVPKMPLSNDKNWAYFYDRKIKPFYQQIPQVLWATHNGQSVENGGRPIVLVYDAYRSFTNLEYSDEMWYAIKNAFAQDFKTAKGVGIQPFVILDYSWFQFNSEKSQLEARVDGEFIWSGGNDTVERTYTLKNFTTTTIDPGLICPPQAQYSQCISKPRNINPLTRATGEQDTRLRALFSKYVPGSNLVLVETWNELWEGTGISQVNYGKKLPDLQNRDSFYINTLANLIRHYRYISPSPQPTPVSNKFNPIGTVDLANCTQLVGWSCDADNFNQAIYVDIYADGLYGQGGRYIGSVSASSPRESAVTAVCGNTPNHGFSFQIPTQLKDGKQHALYTYIHNLPNGESSLLTGSPKYVQCPAR